MTRIDSSEAARAATALLASPPFLLAVALLLLNDHVLKAAYGNWITGKLSDFAGLFAFALFWTALLPRRRGAVFALTAMAFVLWKSSASEPALTAWNALGVLPLARVVDYTDWFALLALVPAYGVARRQESSRAHPRPRPRLDRRIPAVTGAVVAIVAFTATSRGLPASRYPAPGTYLLLATRSEVRTGLEHLSLYEYRVSSERTGPGAGALANTLALRIRLPPERIVVADVELREESPGETIIRVLGVRSVGQPPDPNLVEEAFVDQVFTPLHAWVTRLRGTDP